MSDVILSGDNVLIVESDPIVEIIETEAEPVVEVIEIIEVGPQGPPGPKGDKGEDGLSFSWYGAWAT